MTLGSIIITIVIGGIVGWLASILMKTNAQMGIVANVIVGIVGSFLGGWLAVQLGIGAGSQIVGFLISVGGAVLLIVILRAIGIFR
jgi:uncharacterized membrane protein YeaQ/YmgE (transglycosylase-associated protein family)